MRDWPANHMILRYMLFSVRAQSAEYRNTLHPERSLAAFMLLKSELER